jgi:hypothetical protein
VIKKITSKLELGISSIIYSLILNYNSVYALTWEDCSTAEGVPTLKCLEIVFENIIKWSTGFIVLVLFVMIVVGAFRYLTSGGNPEQLKKAQGTLKYAIIGLVLFVCSYLILNIIAYLLLNGQTNRLLEFKIGE